MTKRRRQGITFGILGLLVVLLIGGFFGIRHVERALTNDSKAWLDAQGQTGVNVDAKGREIVLTGTALPGTDVNALGDELESDMVHQHDHFWSFNDRSGIRYVDTSGLAVADAAVPEPTPEASPGSTPEPTAVPEAATGEVNTMATVNDDQILLTGTVLNEDEHQAILTAAQDSFGAENVTDQIQVSNVEPTYEGADERVRAFAAMLPTLHNRMNGQALLRGPNMRITGVGLDAQAPDDIASFAGSIEGVNATVDIEAPETPEPTEAEAVIENLDLAGVQFDYNTANLTPGAETILDAVATQLNDFPDTKVMVAGYTDSIGDDAYNLTLSQQRAEAVVAYLGERGVETSRLEAKGFGEADPIASNDTEAGRAQNRRVELTVIEGN